MYIHIHIYVYIYACVFLYAYTCTCLFVDMQIYLHMPLCVCMCTYTLPTMSGAWPWLATRVWDSVPEVWMMDCENGFVPGNSNVVPCWVCYVGDSNILSQGGGIRVFRWGKLADVCSSGVLLSGSVQISRKISLWRLSEQGRTGTSAHTPSILRTLRIFFEHARQGCLYSIYTSMCICRGSSNQVSQYYLS